VSKGAIHISLRQIYKWIVLGLLLLGGLLPVQAQDREFWIIDSDSAQVWPPDLPHPSVSISWSQDLQQFYRNQGYLSARIDSSDLAARRVFVSKGILSRIQSIEAPKLAPSYQPILTEASGQPLSSPVIEGIIDTLLERYSADGYLAADIRLDSIGWQGAGFIVWLNVQSGPPATIRGVRLEGDSRTSARLAFDLSGLHSGDPASEVSLDAVRSSVLSRGYHRSVGPPIFELHGDSTATIVIPVVPRSPGMFDMILGFLPPRSTGSGQLVGSGQIELANAFGAGRSFGAEIHRLPGQASSVRLEVEDPLFFGLPLRFRGRFEGYQQDSTYSKTSFGVGMALRLERGVEMGARLRRESTRPGQAGQSILSSSQRVASSAGVFFGIDFRFVRVDNPFQPRRGFSLETVLERGVRTSNARRVDVNRDTLRVSSRDDQERLTMETRLFVPVRRSLSIVMGVDMSIIHSRDLDESELFRIGGASTLRGYDEDRFRGTTVARAMLEVRAFLDNVSYGFAFFDLGFVERRDGGRGNNDDLAGSANWHPGFGFGFVFETAVGPVNISYAMNNEDALAKGKVHLGISFGL